MNSLDIFKPLTETQLLTHISTFYKGSLDFEKAQKLFEFEYGFPPKIKLQKITPYDTTDYPYFVDQKALTYMKELQESGVVNMYMSTNYIQTALGLDRHEAIELLTIYMKDYTKIYHPESLL